MLQPTPEPRERRRRPRDEEHDHGAQLLAAGAEDLVSGCLQRRVAVAGDRPQVGVHLLHVRDHRRRDGRDADRRDVGQLDGAGWNVQGAV